ncbi:MAG TPA: hypothetical protein VGT61_15000 [Thermomicrobiales bacterium]|jgi:hypothetical protein|nr:hypothetical protein [Thermomicrobiales bacterium]
MQPTDLFASVMDRSISRREALTAAIALGALSRASIAIPRAAAQDATPAADGTPESAFTGGFTGAGSTERLMALGLPLTEITVSESGVDAPGQLNAGWNLIGVRGVAPYIAYLDILQFPAGLDLETATAKALDAGSNDIVEMDWHFAGGTNSDSPDEYQYFAIDLPAGDYHIAASYYVPDGASEEIMTLVPLTVADAGDSATPAPAPVADIRLEMNDDLRYIVSPDPVPTGDLLWELVNTGQHMSHHSVIIKYPDGTTADQIIAEFSSLFAGTPPAGEPLAAQALPIGYAALQSGGATTMIELNLTEPGDAYAVICFIMDSIAMRPHLLDGMVTTFTVE